MKKQYKYISRMDYERNKAWWVRIRLYYFGVDLQKNFADSLYGGKKASLKAATAWRDEQIRLLGKKGKRIVKTFHDQPTKRSKTGIVGVSRVVNARTGHTYWSATYYPVPYQSKAKCFSVNKYGERGAKQLAVAARKAGVKQAMDRKGKQDSSNPHN